MFKFALVASDEWGYLLLQNYVDAKVHLHNFLNEWDEKCSLIVLATEAPHKKKKKKVFLVNKSKVFLLTGGLVLTAGLKDRLLAYNGSLVCFMTPGLMYNLLKM